VINFEIAFHKGLIGDSLLPSSENCSYYSVSKMYSSGCPMVGWDPLPKPLTRS